MLNLYRSDEAATGHILLDCFRPAGGDCPHQRGVQFPGSAVPRVDVPPRRPGRQILLPEGPCQGPEKSVTDITFVVLAILIGEILLFLIAHYYILTFRGGIHGPQWEWPGLPKILSNPVFIAIILTALAAGSYFFEVWLDRKRPTSPGPITFTSDRKPVTLPVEEILYVESYDDITIVVATGDRRFRNKTPISQWEAILKPHFIRIHRSYLVNKAAITRVDVDLLYVNDIELPISRKYKDSVVSNLES